MESRDETLQRFFEVKRQLREATSQVLRSNGLNFATLKELEAQAEAIMLEVVDYGGLRFIPTQRAVFAHKNLEPITHSNYIEIHEASHESNIRSRAKQAVPF
jgi:hypothetical protein